MSMSTAGFWDRAKRDLVTKGVEGSGLFLDKGPKYSRCLRQGLGSFLDQPHPPRPQEEWS